MIWKILVFALAGYALYRLFMNDKKKKENNEQEHTEKLIASGQLVQDPSCKTYVDPESAISVRDGEKKYYFCSYECRDLFLKQLEEK